MKKYLFIAAIVCVALVGCQKENSTATVVDSNSPAKVSIKLSSVKAKDTVDDTEAEAKVNSIQAFIFKGNSLDAYDYASAEEISAQAMEVSCTQGARDIWVIANAPSMADVTSRAAFDAAISSLTEDNGSENFVMVGSALGEPVTEEYSKTIAVDRMVSRVRIYQIERKMDNEALKDKDFSIVRAYITNAIGNASYDFTKHPETYSWLSAFFANDGAMATTVPFLYYKFAEAVPVANEGIYKEENDEAIYNFYVYPNEYSDKDESESCAFDQTKLVIECLIDGDYYTYPIPLGAIASNKTYDIKKLTITRLGNPSNGDDNVDEGEDVVIMPATASFTITVNDWEQVLTFGGVIDGNIKI